MKEGELRRIEAAALHGDCILSNVVLEMVKEIRTAESRCKKAVEACVPKECPITGLPFMMMIENPDGVMVPTYGGPFDSYTIPEREVDGNVVRFFRDHYDHDVGGWTDPETIREVVTDEDNVI